MREGRPEAAATIWNPLGEPSDASARAARARLGACLRAIVAGAAGGVFLYLDRSVLAYIVFGIGGLTLIAGLFSPLGAYAAVERWVTRAGDLVGAALTWLLLAPVFFIVMAPFGLIAKRGKRDPLRRRIEPTAGTYWSERDEPRAIDKPY